MSTGGGACEGRGWGRSGRGLGGRGRRLGGAAGGREALPERPGPRPPGPARREGGGFGEKGGTARAGAGAGECGWRGYDCARQEAGIECFVTEGSPRERVAEASQARD